MKRAIHKLQVKQLTTKKAGLLHDGGGLYLQTTKSKHAISRSWLLRFSIHGKERWMGLGAYPTVSLKKAREMADAARKEVSAGIDPIVARDQRRVDASRDAASASGAWSLKQAAEGWIADLRGQWKTKAYAHLVESALGAHVYPVIGHLPVADIKLAEIKLVLQPIWHAKNPTAQRIRSWLERIIDWAINEGHRKDESNPAEVKRLKHAFKFDTHVRRHHPALPYTDAPKFLAELRQMPGYQGARP